MRSVSGGWISPGGKILFSGLLDERKPLKIEPDNDTFKYRFVYKTMESIWFSSTSACT